MTESYAEKMQQKAARLAQISAELDALHAQSCELLGQEHALARVGMLPAVQAEAGAAAGRTSYVTDYLARTYSGPAQTGRQGGQR